MVHQGRTRDTRIPADAQAVSRDGEQLPFRTHAFEEQHELQFEVDDWIDGGPTTTRVTVGDQLAHKGEIEYPLEVAVEVIVRDEVVQGDGSDGLKVADLGPQHGMRLPS